MYAVPPEIYDAVYDRPELKDYDAEAERLRSLVASERPDARTLLDVACGTGLHLERLAPHFEVAGLDLEPRLLARARERVPAARFHEGDMLTFELDERFDVVTCLFSAIAHVRTIERFALALQNFARHLSPGGLVIVEPWLEPERYETGRLDMQVVDRPELKVVRMNTTAREGDVSILEMRYLVGTPSGMRVYEERHEMGLFTLSAQLDAMGRAGLDAWLDPEGLMGRGLLLGVPTSDASPRRTDDA